MTVHIHGGTDICDMLDREPELRKSFPQLLGIADLNYLLSESAARVSLIGLASLCRSPPRETSRQCSCLPQLIGNDRAWRRTTCAFNAPLCGTRRASRRSGQDHRMDGRCRNRRGHTGSPMVVMSSCATSRTISGRIEQRTPRFSLRTSLIWPYRVRTCSGRYWEHGHFREGPPSGLDAQLDRLIWMRKIAENTFWESFTRPRPSKGASRFPLPGESSSNGRANWSFRRKPLILSRRMRKATGAGEPGVTRPRRTCVRWSTPR